MRFQSLTPAFLNKDAKFRNTDIFGRLTIPGFEDVSASLASAGGGTPTLQQVTDEGSSTTTPITASIISASGDLIGDDLKLGTGRITREGGSGPIDFSSTPLTGITNITASGNISSSGQIIGDVVDTSFENFLNFEAATSYTYIAPFPLTINFTGSSTSSMEVVGFVTASANTDTFSIQQTPPITLNIFDKLKITPSSSGLFTFSGSRTI